MKRIIKDIIVLYILNFLLSRLYIHLTGNEYELFDLVWWSICSISIGLSYGVDHILEKYFK